MTDISTPDDTSSGLNRQSTGIPGADRLLNGGLVQGRLYLITGPRGTGKTSFGMSFLETGIDAGDRVLFIHGEESQANLVANAANLDIDLSGAHFLDIGPESDYFTEGQSYDVVEPHTLDEDHSLGEIREAIEDLDPSRVLIDPITQFQYLAPTEYQYRKQLISFTRFLTNQGTTVVATKTPTHSMDVQLESLSDGVIHLDYQDDGRRIRVPKHRGVGQRDGTHGLEIDGDAGLVVYPALRPDRHERSDGLPGLRSGIPELDALIGGAFDGGSTTIISGPTGVGKTTTATTMLTEAVEDDGTALAYLFEESIDTFTRRSEQFGLPVTRLREEGALIVEAVEPLNLSPEEFATRVKTQVEDDDISTVMLDGISGYKTSIKGGSVDLDLQRKLHALARFLTNLDISVLLIDERSEVAGLNRPTSANVSYLADNILFMNYLEVNGDIQRIVGVLKKRVGDHESKPRKFRITSEGLDIGDPLSNLHGILRGIPEQVDPAESAD